MRALFTVSDWPGHYFPMVPFAWALQAAGHEVRVVCHPSQDGTLTGAGLVPVPVLDGPDNAFLARLHNFLLATRGDWPYSLLPPHPVTGAPMADLAEFDFRRFRAESDSTLADAARRGTEAAVRFARWWRPDVVVHDLQSFAGPVVAKLTGAPGLLYLWGPVGTGEDVAEVDVIPADFGGDLERYGLGGSWPELIDWVVDPCPGGLHAPADPPRLPARYVPYNGPGAWPAWLAQEPARPRVAVVWGTSVRRIFGPAAFALPGILAGLAGIAGDVVLAALPDDLQSLPELPPNVRVAGRLPLQLLLASCSAVVHHGGAGCAMTAVAAGVPQLAVPTGLDQFVIARRLVTAGIAAAVPNAELTPARVADAITSLLTQPSYRQRATLMRDRIGSLPSPAQLVTTVQQVVTAHRAAL
jgi:UDP:flavonoid glycosyltransferase YjiC (YdhE family)